MKILVTGGAGYIGSHTCVELLNAGYEIVVVDNYSNSKEEVIDLIKQITGKNFKSYKLDVCDKEALEKVFEENKIDAAIHFAGYKAVGESVVFSSSATVYGKPEKLPIKEDFPLSTTNPYGATKLMIEGILKDLYKADNAWDITILRYFNPIGAHKSGLIGENPNDIPNNLMPYIVKVATGEYEQLKVFGNDYNTIDGTGVRDYIHVVDLAVGHVKAIDKLNGLSIYNLGTGKGTSVLELVNTFSKVNNVKVNYSIVDRRPGDIDACFADATLAFEKLGFKATHTVEDMCRDAYNFVNHKEN